MIAATIDTIIIFTGQMESLAGFYRRGFDLGEPNRSPGHVGFPMKNLYLGFDQIEDVQERPGIAGVSLWFRVDDLDAVFQRLIELGGTVRYPPQLKPMGERLAAVFDPDGNVIGLSQRRNKEGGAG